MTVTTLPRGAGSDGALPPHALPLATPVSHTTHLPVQLTLGRAQAGRALARATAFNPRTGCSSYDLLATGAGIVVWALPCAGFADPEATYLGTILLTPPLDEGRLCGPQTEIVGLVVAPPYSVADLMAHVMALFDLPAFPLWDPLAAQRW